MNSAGAADPVLRTEIDRGIMILTLNRPHARNALSPELISSVASALTQFEQDETVRAGIITGAGSAFCSGLDLKVFADPAADRNVASALIHRFGRLAKPMIGAVNGPAVTGGFELALGCDFLIGSPQALFVDSHATIGAFPGGGLSARLAPVVGVRTAKAISLAGVRMDAQAAHHAGLLVEIVEANDLVGRARELAANIAAARPEFVKAVRTLYDENTGRSLANALAAERTAHQRWRRNQPLRWSV